MQVYVLEGRIGLRGAGCVLGVYSTREAAEAAAQADRRSDSHISHMLYVVHAIGVNDPVELRILVDDEDYVTLD